MLHGTKLVDATTNLATVSNFLVIRLVWPSDGRDLHIILTDEGKMFWGNFYPDLCNKEGFIKYLRNHQELLEFCPKYSMEDPIANDT